MTELNVGQGGDLERAWDAYHRLELERARALFEAAVAERPDSVAGHQGLGRTLIRMRREEDAHQQVERCLALGPEEYETHALAGLYYFLVDALDEAQASLEKATALEPQEIEPHVVRAQVHADKGAFAEAEADLTRARELIDALEDEAVQRRERAALLHAETYVALSAKREDEARAKAEEALAYADANPHAVCLANTNLGLMAARQKRWDEAVGYLTAALELNPAFYRARGALGRVYLVTGRPEEAAAALEATLETMPQPDAHTVMACASALSKIGRREEAAALYRRALKLNPRWVERIYAGWQSVWQDRKGRLYVLVAGAVALGLWLWLTKPSPQAITLVLLVVVILLLQRAMSGRKPR